MPNIYEFDCYDLSMSPQERRDFFDEHAEKLNEVIYGDISQMTTNETITLWRKLYGNSHSASPIISHLGSTIEKLFIEIESVKNIKKSQLRKKTITINENKKQLSDIQEKLHEKDNALDRLTSTYKKLQQELDRSNIDTINTYKMMEDIEQAKQHQKLLLASIYVMVDKIKKYNIPLSPDELPHYVSKVKPDDLLINK